MKIRKPAVAILVIALLLTITAVFAAPLIHNDDHQVARAYSYVGNTNSGQFHYASCTWAQRIAEHHRVYFESRDEAINAGYVPCKVCKP